MAGLRVDPAAWSSVKLIFVPCQQQANVCSTHCGLEGAQTGSCQGDGEGQDVLFSRQVAPAEERLWVGDDPRKSPGLEPAPPALDLAPSLLSCVGLGKSFSLSEP